MLRHSVGLVSGQNAESNVGADSGGIQPIPATASEFS